MFHSDFERDLERLSRSESWASPARSYLDTRSKTATLRSDLGLLGHDPAVYLARERVQLKMPHIADAWGLWGALYVIEGSTLGGQFIAMKLQEHAKYENAVGYFRGAGRDSASRWKDFVAQMDELKPSPEETQSAIRGALETFASFEAIFTVTH